MRWLSILIILLILSAWVFVALSTIYSSKKFPASKRLLLALGGCLMLIGALGFFGSAISASGGLDWLPKSFEWPIGRAAGIATMPDGTHVVPHDPSNRIQIYDSNWKFLRGWYVKAGSGTFKIKPLDKDRFEVVTSRGRNHFIYNLNGDLLSEEKYPPSNSSEFQASKEKATVPTPFYLYGFTNPFIAWVIAVAGGLLIAFTQKYKSADGSKSK